MTALGASDVWDRLGDGTLADGVSTAGEAVLGLGCERRDGGGGGAGFRF